MEITEKQINDFIEENDMKPLGGDCFEDAGGQVWHEANIIEWLNLKTFTPAKKSTKGHEVIK